MKRFYIPFSLSVLFVLMGFGIVREPKKSYPPQRIAIYNEGETIAQNVQLIFTDHTILGSITTDELIRNSVFGGKIPRDEIQGIWEYLNETFTHYCSLGSPIDLARQQSTLLQRIFSYSFACCSDVNPILEQLLLSRGYEVRRLFSNLHQALEVETKNGWRYIDSDHEKYFDMDLETIQKGVEQDAGYDGENYYAWLFNEENTIGGSPYQAVTLDLDFLAPISIDLAPEESIEFLYEFDFARAVAFPALVNSEEDPDWGTTLGLMTSRFTYVPVHHLTSDEPETEGETSCSTFSVKTPYVIQSASLIADSHWPDTADLYVQNLDTLEPSWLPVPEEVLQSDRTIPLDYELFSFGEKTYELNAENIGIYWGGYSYSFWPEDIILGQGKDFLFGLPQEYQLFEDGIPLGPSNSLLEDVMSLNGSDYRFMGGGNYTLQNGQLTFSTSDGTDPRTNGRTYTFVAKTYSYFWDTFGQYQLGLKLCGVDDAFLDALRLQVDMQFNRRQFPSSFMNFELKGNSTEDLQVTMK